MAKSDGTIFIDTLIDTKEFSKIHNELSYSTKGMAKLGSTVTKVGATMTAGLTMPIAIFGKSAVSAASDMEENINKVDVAFGRSAENVKAWAETATESFGLSKNQALEAASLFGDMGTSMGLTQEEASNMSTSLAGLAGDLASFKNIDIEQAMTALNGVFTGETESLKTLGVVMTETNLKQFAEDAGLVYKEMSQAEKVQLRYAYVMEMTKNAQGDYARTSDGTANSIRTMEASIENLRAALGEHLLPVITPIIQGITDLIKKFGEMDPSTQKLIVIVAAVAAAIGPLVTIIGGIISALSTIIPIIVAVIGAINPITLAIGAAVAAIALLIANWDAVKAKMQEFDIFLQEIFAKDFTEIFGPVLGESLNVFFKNVENIWNSVKEIFNGIIHFVENVFAGNWKGAWRSIAEIFEGIWHLMFSVMKVPINGIIGMINSLISGVTQGINAIIDLLNNLSFDIPDWVPEFGGKTFGFDIPKITPPKIPYLATGAVIPPNAPFMAMLGDQTHGRNLEAPEDLIRKIVREESGSSRELIPYLEELIKYSKETANKEWVLGDREIAKANLRGQSSIGFSLITEG